MARWLLCLILGLAALGATAREAAPASDDPVLEKKMMRIAEELRCLVCQNQTIAESDADLAQDLRREVRSMLREGKSEDEVLQYMTQRYGDFVLYRPPVKDTTLVLWFGPAALLVGGLLALVIVLRRRARMADDRFEADADDARADGADDGATT